MLSCSWLLTRFGDGAAGAAAPIRHPVPACRHIADGPVAGVLRVPFHCRRTPMKTGFCGNAKPNEGLPCRAKMMTPGRARSCARSRSAASPAQGWGASRGIKGGSAPLARSYRGPDNVAGPIMGHLNPALAVVSRCQHSKLSHAGRKAANRGLGHCYRGS